MIAQLATVVAPTAGLGIALLLCLAIVCRLLDSDREAADIQRIDGLLTPVREMAVMTLAEHYTPGQRPVLFMPDVAARAGSPQAWARYTGRAVVPTTHLARHALEAVSAR